MSARERIAAAWPEGAPDWIVALAEACGRESQAAAARRLDCSASLVSQVLARRYPGDLARVEAMVRGAYMAVTVGCPVLGEIAVDRCLTEQGRPWAPTNHQRVRLWKACRGGCPHSRLESQR